MIIVAGHLVVDLRSAGAGRAANNNMQSAGASVAEYEIGEVRPLS